MAGLAGPRLMRRGGRLEDTEADKVAATVAACATGTGIRRIARDFRVGSSAIPRLTKLLSSRSIDSIVPRRITFGGARRPNKWRTEW
jgi:hypothetical protein